jgi:4-methylaminobutanoate oxidase (formaldehyde-forming)
LPTITTTNTITTTTATNITTSITATTIVNTTTTIAAATTTASTTTTTIITNTTITTINSTQIDHFMQIWEGAEHRVPSLADAEINTFVNGPESFTTDNQFILGEAPECRGFFVAAGFNSAGIANAAGAGILMADWITEGVPTRDVWNVDIRRFGNFHSSPQFLRDRVQEVLGLHYAMPWPRKELASARGLRRSPMFDIYKKKGASFGQKFGWERVNYFVGDDDLEAVEKSFTIDTKPAWLPYVAAEHQHTRTKVSLFDVSSFAKFLVKGADAETVMQRLCCASVEALGRAHYTGMLNKNGGYETDCTVTRVGDSEFLVISPTAQATRDADWIRRNIDLQRENVTVTDVTSSTCVFALMGPQSRELLQSVTLADMSNEAFPFGKVQDISVGYTAVRAGSVVFTSLLPPAGDWSLPSATLYYHNPAVNPITTTDTYHPSPILPPLNPSPHRSSPTLPSALPSILPRSLIILHYHQPFHYY